MKIDIDNKVIKQWEKESKEEGEEENVPLTSKVLKEMVEEYLYDYFS